jgi:hypothetical protein
MTYPPPTLRAIGADLDVLHREIADAEGELTPELLLRLEALNFAEADKVDGYHEVIRAFERQAEAYKAEADAMAIKAKQAQNKADQLMGWLKLYMTTRGLTALAGTLRQASIVANGGKQGLDLIPDAVIPANYQRVTVSPDLDKIRVDGVVGEDGSVWVPSTLDRGSPVLVARLKPRGTHLRWR